MCGICGFVSQRSEILKNKETIIRRMNSALRHRGPDDEGYFFGDNISLGMRRLSIIDITTGHQPIYNEDKSKCIISNGEIYNFKELRDKLKSHKHSFSTNSDTEIILHLYEDMGVDCLKELNGMFAFAIYDKKDDSLFIARDRLGVKPLHYYFYDNEFIFASEIKAILEFPFAKKEIDLNSLNVYLTFEYIPTPKTIYKGIYKLKQGHYIIFKDGLLKSQLYWNLNFRNKIKFNEQEIIDRLRYLIDDSVRLRLISDVPVGAFLSGGIDSSLVVAFMMKHSYDKVKTFNISFEEKSFDESAYAQLTSEYIGTQHYEQKLTPRIMQDVIPDVIRALDEPFADASIIPTYLLAKFARGQVSVVLTGDGGDELFAGYPTYQAHKITKFIPSFMYGPLIFLANRLPISDHNISLDFRLKRMMSAKRYPPGIRNQIWLGSFSPEEKKELFLKDIYDEIRDNSEFEIVDYYQSMCGSEDSLDKILYQDLKLYLQDDMLVKVDRASMANSLETRNPYLDYRLVEFVGSLPSALKLKFFTTKYILKKASKGEIPDYIIARPKKGFGVPIAKWLKKDLKHLLFEFLSEERIKKERFFNFKYINKLIDEHLANKRDNRKLLWTLLMFEMWLNKNELIMGH